MTIVTVQDATLNLPGSRNLGLEATHSALAKFPSTASTSYQLVLNVMIRLVSNLAPAKPISRPPTGTSPPAESGLIPEAKRIDFQGLVDVFSDSLLDPRGGLHSVSDMLEKAPSDLLKKYAGNAPPMTSPATPGKSLLYWVHIPLNNTAWVNVSTSRRTTQRPGSLADCQSSLSLV
jgi:hypothetical protein